MTQSAVLTDRAPAPIGPYSQAVAFGELLFTSGQIALDPTTGQMVGETAAEQARQVMENLGQVLKAGQSAFDMVVKTTIFLVSMDDFAAVNEVYGGYFGAVPPARSTVAVAALPKGARVEIEAVARRAG